MGHEQGYYRVITLLLLQRSTQHASGDTLKHTQADKQDIQILQ